MPTFQNQFSTSPYDDKPRMLSPSQSSLIVAMLSAGTVVGSLLAAPVGDWWGRRKSLIASVGVFCFGVIFQVCSADIPMVAGRQVCGREPRTFHPVSPSALLR